MAIIEAPTGMERNPFVVPVLSTELLDLRGFDANALAPEPSNIVSNALGAGGYILSVRVKFAGPPAAWGILGAVNISANFFLEGLGGGAPEVDIPPVITPPAVAPPLAGEILVATPVQPTAPLFVAGISRLYRVSAAVQVLGAGGAPLFTGFIDGAILNVVA